MTKKLWKIWELNMQCVEYKAADLPIESHGLKSYFFLPISMREAG